MEVKKKYENYGIQLVKAKEKLSVINNYEKGLYIELDSFVIALNVGMNKFLEEISFYPAIRGYFAHFREGNRIFKVINVECLNLLIRHLASCGYDVENLKSVKSKVLKAIEQFERS